jgi:hypothetical protein
MTTECLQETAVLFRNFNLCPHCIFVGQQPLLCRLCEGLPMISRSDGETFHLLLADHPRPYPSERTSGATGKISVCFWYCRARRPRTTFSVIVILPESRTNHPTVFRMIEAAADLLAEKLTAQGQLSEIYEFFVDGAAAVAS